MKNVLITLLFASLFLLMAACNSGKKSSSPKENRTTITSNDIELSGGWARPASKGGNSAAYLRIFNGTDATDTLMSVTSQIAEKAEVHESYEKNGMSGMRPAGHQAIKQDSTFQLQPGGFHIMLMQLNQSIAAVDSIRLTLQFSNAGPRRITIPVQVSNN